LGNLAYTASKVDAQVRYNRNGLRIRPGKLEKMLVTLAIGEELPTTATMRAVKAALSWRRLSQNVSVEAAASIWQCGAVRFGDECF
jgi:hypothetical protein